MPTTSDGVIKALHAGVVFESVDATGKTSDGVIKIGRAIIATGGTPRFVNCQSLTSDALIKVYKALGGRVELVGV
ncbi:hypothetical protein C8J42_101928 [Sphingomonas sp. PP-CE-1A-559]|nr:hypothetical protein C8J42_101928 [Sphingomonas sp. PP-CE-1A-559]